MKEIEIAKIIATVAHAGQFRRDGVTPYVTHPLRVASKVSSEAAVAAILHDSFEDNVNVTPIIMLELGIGRKTVEAVKLLTRKQGQDYFEDYIKPIKKNKIAREVKIADIEDNMSSKNLKPAKIEKYKQALEYLKS